MVDRACLVFVCREFVQYLLLNPLPFDMSTDPPPPSLALGDIIHLMSPSPAPTDPANVTAAPTPETQSEPISDPDRAHFLKRLTELGLPASEGSNLNSRERELVDMVRSFFICFSAEYISRSYSSSSASRTMHPRIYPSLSVRRK